MTPISRAIWFIERHLGDEIALDAGYGSHEAFTRAFRDRFGLTPQTVRARAHVDDLMLVEPLKMDEQSATISNRRVSNNGNRC